MVPFEVGNNQQRQQVMPSAGMEIVPTNLPVNQQIQVANKFAVLENEESDVNGANQLTVVNTNNVSSPNPTSQVFGRSLNVEAPAFDPKSNEKKIRKANNGTKDAVHTGRRVMNKERNLQLNGLVELLLSTMLLRISLAKRYHLRKLIQKNKLTKN